MGVLDGQSVSAAVTNPAFINKNNDDDTPSRLGVQSSQPNAGPSISASSGGIQRVLNALSSYTGMPASNAYNTTPNWTANNRGTSLDTLLARIQGIDNAFHPSTGHKHTGAAGDAPQISAPDIINVQLQGYVIQGTNLTGVTGSTFDVSSLMAGFPVSTGQTVVGVVTNTPYNKLILRNSVDDSFTDSFGNIVYGRLTNTGGPSGTWTISFYVDIAGVETAYSFVSSTIVKWYYQYLYNPLGASTPVYSQFAFIPSDNATADVITATQSIQGKVSLASSSPGAIASTGSSGTANATVANSDHTHEGVHSVKAFGQSQILGDAVFNAGAGITLGQSGSTITITGTVQPISKKENFTLTGTDITNQYIDLTQVAKTDSIIFTVTGLIQAEGSDYTVSYTGGAGGKTRITFAGDLVTGGLTALVSGDVVRIQYQY